ncbi:MAG: hypothetical protein P0Y63_05360 [Klebsiella huaxiensis]|uniref:hypothetical protein n=1 Tax=Klebsiella huaxiensis TaxID=2153354 RepID=UPI0026ED5DD1|nr:hypothetical protein [Klebsiella huaxiensis]WEJ90452.1 MAG: hypothetical protein P0Y63_05360 [Klebsiella huaxiensis]
MSDKKTVTVLNAEHQQYVLNAEHQQYVFTTKAKLLAELIFKQMPTKSEAEELAKMVNSAFEKLTA